MNPPPELPHRGAATLNGPAATPPPDPGMIFAHAWLTPQPRALPTGDVFCALRIAEPRATAAFDKLISRGSARCTGPVLSHYDQTYFIIRPGPDPDPWPSIARYCGYGSFITVPAPQTTTGWLTTRAC